MLMFIAGFVACYLLTAVAALAWGWHFDGRPREALAIVLDMLCALLWPLVFTDGDGFSGGVGESDD